MMSKLVFCSTFKQRSYCFFNHLQI